MRKRPAMESCLARRRCGQGVETVVLALMILGSTGAAAAGGGWACLPTCEADDARFLTITGEGGPGSLSLGSQEFGIAVTRGASSFQLGIFDGDVAETDTAGDAHWDPIIPATATYTLIADPLNDGSGTAVVATFDGSTMPDNDWIDFTIATGPEAQSPGGGFFYRLLAELPSSAPSSAFNSFKLRTTDVITVARSEVRPYAFQASMNSFADLEVVYPDFPSPTPSTYNGVFSLFFEVFAPEVALVLWDGDFDRGRYDGSESDSDDPNTPGDSLPPWSATSASFEGVATGLGPSTGNPPDDRQGGGLNDLFLRTPSVRYDLVFPDGRVFANNNPSGNLEWERFSITTGPFDPLLHDYSTTDIPAGMYEVRVEGMDLSNQSHLVLPRPALCVREDGNPCRPLSPFVIGGTVFLDTDGNGAQDFGEIGLDGVALDLYGIGGGPIAQAWTDSSGNYSFEVDAGSYSVDVPASNFGTGSPLAGLVATVANTLDTSVVDDNDLALDFGYRPIAPVGTGSSGYWKNHPADWPVDSLVAGGTTYSRSEVIALMRQPIKGDMSLAMFRQYVAARLNLAAGADSGCISDTLFDADQWLAAHPPGSAVKAKSAAWKDEGEALEDELEDYNNGRLCASQRDSGR